MRFPFPATALVARLFLAVTLGVAAFGASAAPTVLRNPNDDPALGDAVPGQRFGESMALDGATLAVGSFDGRTAAGARTGAVYVFVRSGDQWISQAKLLPPDGRDWDGFGASVALQGDTLVVGAPNVSRNEQYYTGAAYVFRRSAGVWSHAQTLSEATPTQDAFFGAALALDGDRLAVGAAQHEVSGVQHAGAVVTFRRTASGWQREQLIPAPAPLQHGMFGSALAWSGDQLLVGAYGEAGQAGGVYAFAPNLGEWTLEQRFVAAATARSDFFGFSLAVNGGRLLVGAPAYFQGRTGTAVEWRRVNGTWVEADTLRVAGQAQLRHFGWTVAHHAGRWLVGAERYAGPTTPMSGVELFAYEAVNGQLQFERQTSVPCQCGIRGHALAFDAQQIFVGLPYSHTAPWSDAGEVRVLPAKAAAATAQASINAGVTATLDYFGSALAANAGWLMVGAPYEHRNSAHAGAVFAYARGASDVPQPIAPADGARDDRFGSALAFSGNTLLVGAPVRDGVGTVRTFERDGTRWTQRDEWRAPNPATYAYFGNVVAADASTAVVGAHYEAQTGAAYVYERNAGGWAAPTRLVASDAASTNHFGAAAAVDGATAVVASSPIVTGDWGEPLFVDGAAYVFVRGAAGWSEQARLVRPFAPVGNAQFGAAVAISGDTVFVGGPLLKEVHVFSRLNGVWNWRQRIAAPTGVTGAFGARLHVANGELFVGAPQYYAGDGSLHRYRKTASGWRLIQSFRATTPGQGAGLGEAFAAHGNTVFAGEPRTPGYAPFVNHAGAVQVDEIALHSDGFED